MALLLNSKDNVATTIKEIPEGTIINLDTLRIDCDKSTIETKEHIQFGHKFALRKIYSREPVYKYGEPIGEATEIITAGDWVHTHNCESRRGRGDIDEH